MVRFTGICLALLSTLAWSNDENDEVFNFEGEFSNLSTTTRLNTHIDETPASVTVITGDKLKRLGIVEIPEALRLVSGMFVAKLGGADWRISYHGTTALTPRRTQLLIDGLSFYDPGYARINWSQLPITIDDIERIEVTRGANSATYGANSFMSVINIVTKPIESRTNKILLSGGSHTEHRIGLASDEGFVNFTKKSNEGYDSSNLYENRHDSSDYKSINAGYKFYLENHDISLRGGKIQGTQEEQFVHPTQTNFPDNDIDDVYLSLQFDSRVSDNYSSKVTLNSRKVERIQEWNSCLPTLLFMPELYELSGINYDLAEAVAGQQPINPAELTAEEIALVTTILTNAAIAGQDPNFPQFLCGNTNQNYTDSFVSAEYQGTYIGEQFRAVFGLGFKEIKAKSETFLGGRASFRTAQLFGNIEYRLNESTLLNAGGMFEQDSGHNGNDQFTPRFAINKHINDTTWLRAVYSKATRTPDLWERSANWSYLFTDLTPNNIYGDTTNYFSQAVIQNDGLESEKIESIELGIRAYFNSRSSYVDVKIFKDNLTDLISEPLGFTTLTPTNSSSVDLKGVEIEGGVKQDNFDLNFNYAYLDNDTTQIHEKGVYARHSGSLIGTWNIEDSSSLSSVYYYQQNLNSNAFRRIDLTYSKIFQLSNEQDFFIKASIIHYISEDQSVSSDNSQPFINYYDNSNQYRVTAEYSF